MIIKICGITNMEDAELAAENGASVLGFNFYRPSPRFIEPVEAAAIIKCLPNRVRSAGVFVNAGIDLIKDYVDISCVNSIQLHGDESPEIVSAVREHTKLEVIKAIRVGDGFEPRDVCATGADAVLLDTYASDVYGGTGESFGWNLAKDACRLFPRIYLAGGLGVDNVVSAITEVRPFGIDTCSAIESSKGRKDPSKLIEFLELATAFAEGSA